ncbi:MAG: ABC transporter permease, partial [Bacteroidota bacterium]|nr:ABC transporter permease [Bacteroidota bacterium]
FSFINIFGLSIGLTCCMLIALYIRHELSYDAFQQNRSRIARVIMEYSFDGGTQSNKGNYTSVRVASVFKSTFPEVEAAVKMTRQARIVKYKENMIDEKNVYFADSNFFHVFSFHLLQGDPHHVLEAPNRIVLSRSTANRYFGDENPVGKSLNMEGDNQPYLVTGVAEDCPSNSQIKFDFLASFSSLGLSKEFENTYWDANYTTYLLLKEPKARESLQAKLPAFMKKEMAGQGASVNFWLEPFSDIHLHSEFDGFEPNNNILNIYMLAGVALLILIIASSTFINLSTAQSLERAKEVGVRKVIGAGRQQLFWQFMGESGAVCMVALLCSLFLAAISLPYYNKLTGKTLSIQVLFSLPFLFFSLMIAVLVMFVAGSYPALILTRFQPVKVLKGSFRHQGSGQRLRTSLIVFQFTISVFMIVSTLIIQKQLFYIQHKNLGYDRSRVLVLPADNSFYSRIPLIKQTFKSDPEIISVSACVRTPVEGGGGYNMRSSLMPSNQQIAVIANPVDEDFIKTTGISLLAGQDLTVQDIRDISDTDQSKRLYHFILNESAARELGWTPDEAIGKKMFLGDSRSGLVRGVVRDFHFESLHHPVKSIVLFAEPRANKLLIKLNGRNLPGSISFLETQWKRLFPDRPFEYHFLDEDFNKLYISELRLGRIIRGASLLAITLACLGLFGLSSYSVHQRIKEISVRKVLGASVRNILVLLSGKFIRLALISLLIAFPLAWWLMNSWLNGFSYRTTFGVDIFLKAGAVTLLITLITISFQSVKAALAKPAKSLKSE